MKKSKNNPIYYRLEPPFHSDIEDLMQSLNESVVDFIPDTLYIKRSYLKQIPGKEIPDSEIGWAMYDRRSFNYIIFLNPKILHTEVGRIVFIHEMGHLYYEHVNNDYKLDEEFVLNRYFELFPESKGVKTLSHKGVRLIINMAMDAQINSSLLTREQIDHMKSNGYDIIDIESEGLPLGLDWKEYVDHFLNKAEESYDGSAASSSKGEQGQGEGQGSDSSGFSKWDSQSIDVGDLMDGKDKSEKQSIGNGDGTPDGEDGITEDNTKEGDKDDSTSRGGSDRGSGTGGSQEIEIINSSESLTKLIQQLFPKRSSMDYYIDSMRHHNRGSRSNPYGILYSSVKRKRLTTRNDIVIIVDTSGSMRTELVQSIIDSIAQLPTDCKSENSKVLLVHSKCYAVYSIKDIKGFHSMTIESGGTDLDEGVDYIIDSHLKCNRCLIISDMGTPIEPLNKSIARSNFEVIGLGYDCNKRDLEVINFHRRILVEND